jgi:two-component system, LytTR family, response regulator
MRIRTLIVDDEPIARKRLRRFLLQQADVEIAGEAANGCEAVDAIKKLAPDLLLLDVQMPEMDGFQVLRAVGAEAMPVVIFVTAYDEFALQAFEAQAIDYLLKPFDYDRFQKAFERAKTYLQGRGTGARRLSALVDALSEPSGMRSRLAVRSDGRVLFLNTREIDWVEAVGNYVSLHVGREKHLLRGTMNEFEDRLSSDRFLRIHRSTLVNLDAVREVRPSLQGESVVLLKDGTRLNASRSGSQKLLGLARQSL